MVIHLNTKRFSKGCAWLYANAFALFVLALLCVTALTPRFGWAQTATGFAISQEGHIMTVAHGFKDPKNIQILVKTASGKTYEARLLAFSKKMDVAILKIPASTKPVTFARTSPAATSEDKTPAESPQSTSPPLGLEVVVLGYPLPKITGENLKVTNGIITSTTGLKGNKNTFQISAEVQSGNSGSPVLSPDAKVIGMVLGKLNPKIREDSARLNIPQNMNVATKAGLLEKLAGTLGLTVQSHPLDLSMTQRPMEIVTSEAEKVFQIVTVPKPKPKD